MTSTVVCRGNGGCGGVATTVDLPDLLSFFLFTEISQISYQYCIYLLVLLSTQWTVVCNFKRFFCFIVVVEVVIWPAVWHTVLLLLKKNTKKRVLAIICLQCWAFRVKVLHNEYECGISDCDLPSYTVASGCKPVCVLLSSHPSLCHLASWCESPRHWWSKVLINLLTQSLCYGHIVTKW